MHGDSSRQEAVPAARPAGVPRRAGRLACQQSRGGARAASRRGGPVGGGRSLPAEALSGHVVSDVTTRDEASTGRPSSVEWANRQDTVRVLILTSSHTSPKSPVDILSDYDLIMVLTDIHPFYNRRDWLSDFGPLLTLYRNPIMWDNGLEHSCYIVQYENGLKIDFTLWSVAFLQRLAAQPKLPDEFDAGYRVLLDKDSLTTALQPPTYAAYIPLPPTATQYTEKAEIFFLDAIYVAKFLWRDDLVAAKHLLDHFMKQEHLIPLLEWHFEIDHNWSVKPGPYGRRLKQWLRPDLWQQLESTYTGVDIEENWTALYATITLFRQAAIEVGKHFGYAYPHDLDQRCMAYLQKIKKLASDADVFS